jgi:hypothetical protein
MMTATEMEDVLKNIDLRLTKVEQILPTLATKEDLKAFATKEDLKVYPTRDEMNAGFNTLRQEMKEMFAEAKRHASVLFEKTQSELETIAAHLADFSQRLPPRA